MAHRRRGRPVSAGGNGVGVGVEFGVRVKVGMHATCTWTCHAHAHAHGRVYYVRMFKWRCPRVKCRRLLLLVGAVTVEALAADAHLDDEHPLHAVSE